MEDAHAAVLDLQAKYVNNSDEPTESSERISFFGVYDGHGGDQVAQFAGENIHKIVAKQESFLKGDIEQALKDAFLATDRAILEDPTYEYEVSGSTAAVGLISRKKIWVANAGDSRSVLGIKGRAKPLSFDHKPQNEGEKARISAAGGFVDFGRVCGNLALSRAIGDFEFKKGAKLSPEQQIVTAYPDVTVHDVTDDDEFLVIACDGIWDCQSSQAVIEFVRRGIAAKQELSLICENMMNNCLASNSETAGVGCDNMTMIIVGLLNNKTKEEWYNQIAERVANGDGPCAPPEFAEFRGPPVRHRESGAQEEEDEHEIERLRSFGVRSGRIILLGDGTEVFTEQNDEEMFDRELEDHDADDQLERESFEATRSEREGTPGPQPQERAAAVSGAHAASISESPTPADADESNATTASASASSVLQL